MCRPRLGRVVGEQKRCLRRSRPSSPPKMSRDRISFHCGTDAVPCTGPCYAYNIICTWSTHTRAGSEANWIRATCRVQTGTLRLFQRALIPSICATDPSPSVHACTEQVSWFMRLPHGAPEVPRVALASCLKKTPLAPFGYSVRPPLFRSFSN